MPRISSAYRGPAAVMGVGGGFALVGSLPVGITFGLGLKNSATIIGMGFMGFGLLVLVPGFCWCFVVQHRTYKSWLRTRRVRRGLSEEEDIATLPPDDQMNVELDSVLISDKLSRGSYGGTTLNFFPKPEKAPLASDCHQEQELIAVDEQENEDCT